MTIGAIHARAAAAEISEILGNSTLASTLAMLVTSAETTATAIEAGLEAVAQAAEVDTALDIHHKRSRHITALTLCLRRMLTVTTSHLRRILS